jgi:hypothetical protein
MKRIIGMFQAWRLKEERKDNIACILSEAFPVETREDRVLKEFQLILEKIK